ncbi:MAG: UDP-glucose 4-epimerase GalE [Erysipelotrichaceae bacterium]|nr:UDP-glucose 4-epimerase GalE [Erysipelotrichaceae bacterium]
MNILVTGGTGYIGSHTVVELLNRNHNVIIVDNLSNSKYEVLNRIKKITNKDVTFYQIDVCNKEDLKEVFNNHKIDSVIHFAGLKAVGESTEIPLKYYENNILSTLSLLEVMKEFNCKNLIFSSSATVYGFQSVMPINEDASLSATNPYGRTKLFIEYILKDLCLSDKSWNIAMLRYFNPVGAHSSGLIGEDPNGIPNNLCPYITQVAIGKLPYLNVFGDDYDTIDGTGVRDYIHVVDLAIGHVCAINKLTTNPGLVIYNLGAGKGYSVLEMVKAFEKATGKKIAYKITPRRAGDIGTCYADASKAYNEMGFKTSKTIDDMAIDAWRFQQNNPDGIK